MTFRAKNPVTESQGSKPKACHVHQTPPPSAPALPAQAHLGGGRSQGPRQVWEQRVSAHMSPILHYGISSLGEETLPQLCRPSNQVRVVALNTKRNIWSPFFKRGNILKVVFQANFKIKPQILFPIFEVIWKKIILTFLYKCSSVNSLPTMLYFRLDAGACGLWLNPRTIIGRGVKSKVSQKNEGHSSWSTWIPFSQEQTTKTPNSDTDWKFSCRTHIIDGATVLYKSTDSSRRTDNNPTPPWVPTPQTYKRKKSQAD